MEKLVIKNSRWQFMLLLVACVGFVAVGVALLARGNWFGLVPIIFFGSGIPIFVWQIMDARPRLVIDEHGVFDRTLGVGRIAWRDIEAAWVASIRGYDFICLELRNSDEYRRRLSKVKRAMASANRNLGFTDFSLNLAGVNASTEQVFELLLKFCERSRLDDPEAPSTLSLGRRWRR